MRLNKMDHKYKKIFKRIKDAGFEAYIVGGSVRDMLLKKESSDIDITTNAKYNDLKKLFHDVVDVSEVGKNFQVLIVNGIEIATYRNDVYDKELGNMICTKQVESIEEDLSRRDLTINSMAFDPTNKGIFDPEIDDIIDPFNGIYDIKHKIIRFTGDAKQRIHEDPVRMLRACRFLAMIDNSRFARDTFYAIHNCVSLIYNVPKERIRLEIIKAMKAKNAGNFFRALKNTGLLSYVFPGMDQTIDHTGGIFHNETIFDHCVMTCDNIDGNPLLKIAAFLHDIGKPDAYLLNSNGSFKGHEKFGSDIVIDELKRLKFSNTEIVYITGMIKVHMFNFDIDSTERTTRKLLVKLKQLEIDYSDFIKHVIADHDANMKKEPHPDEMFDTLMLKCERILEKEHTFSVKDLTINGNDVMNYLAIPPSKKVGDILQHLFEMVVDNPELNTKEQLLQTLLMF